MVILHIVILLLLAIGAEYLFGSEKWENWLCLKGLDKKPLNCKSCLTFWLTFLYAWIFLFPLSWALVVGFVFFALSIMDYTSYLIEWIIKQKRS